MPLCRWAFSSGGMITTGESPGIWEICPFIAPGWHTHTHVYIVVDVNHRTWPVNHYAVYLYVMYSTTLMKMARFCTDLPKIKSPLPNCQAPKLHKGSYSGVLPCRISHRCGRFIETAETFWLAGPATFHLFPFNKTATKWQIWLTHKHGRASTCVWWENKSDPPGTMTRFVKVSNCLKKLLASDFIIIFYLIDFDLKY